MMIYLLTAYDKGLGIPPHGRIACISKGFSVLVSKGLL